MYHFSLIAIFAALATLLVIPIGAVPFASVASNLTFTWNQDIDFQCYFNASSLEIDLMNSTDLLSFPQTCQQTCITNLKYPCPSLSLTLDLSSNHLSNLPSGLAAAIAAPITTNPINQLTLNLILSFNKFSSTSIGNFFPTNASDDSVFGGFHSLSLDLSGNKLGPNFPTTFQNFPLGSLILRRCGIINIPPYALDKCSIGSLDMAYNDLRKGLHAFSFSGMQIGSLILSNTNLRTESLPLGFLFTMQPASTSLRLSNNPLAPDVAAMLTPQAYLSTMPNAFINLTNAAFNAPPIGSGFSQVILSNVYFGDLVSMAYPSFFLGNCSLVVSNLGDVVITLASSVAATALSVFDSFCPGPTFASAISISLDQPVTFGTLPQLAVEGFNLSATPPTCQYPDQPTSPWTSLWLTVPTEPPFLQRSFTSWLAQFPYGGFSSSMVAWAPPMYNLWNPSLNVSNWVDVQLLKDLNFNFFTLPGLPLQFTFPPPDGMLGYLESSRRYAITWTLANRFSSGMLDGRYGDVGSVPFHYMTLPARLYAGVDPVPLDFFTPFQDSEKINIGLDCGSMSDADCALAFANQATFCPRIVNQICLPCPDGWFTSAYTNLLVFCQRCPSGSRCVNAEGNHPIRCLPGYFQPFEAQTQCTSCEYGTYNPTVGASSPAACVQCPPGRYNPTRGSANETACLECPVGRASSIPGVAACGECPVGYYQNMTNQFSCIACGRNTYFDQLGATSPDQCQPCPPDSPLSPPGSGSVFACSTGIVCEDGYYTLVSDPKPCQTLCPLGSFCKAGKASLCAAGSYSNRTGAQSCIACGPGKFSSTVGSASSADCTVCPRSTYSAAQTSAFCTACSAGKVSAITGASDATGCVATATGCFTPADLATRAPVSGTSQFCPLAAVEPISLTPMLGEGLQTMQQFYSSLPKAVSGRNVKENMNRDTDTTNSDNWDNSTIISDLYRRYSTVRTAPSLRIAAFGSDSTLEQWEADQAFADTNSISSGTTASALASTQTVVIFIILCSAAIASWPIYRFIPATVAWHVDQFSTSHQIPDQGGLTKQRTQFGSAMTWSFLCISVLVAILLATAPNTTVSTALVPPSSLPSAGQAKAQFQFTIRAYSSADSVASYCTNDDGPRISQEGFTLTFVSRSLPQGQICSVAVDCYDCGLSAGASSIAFSFPYFVQLLEWEIWVSAAAPGTWTRRYGVLSQLPSNFMSASSQLEVSAIEAYHEDHSRRGDGEVKSGFEIDFLRYTSLSPQPKDSFNSDSRVELSFVLQKSDIMFTSTIANKLSLIQLLVSIITSIVSLFTIFAILFRKVEQFGLQGLLNASSGFVVRDSNGSLVVTGPVVPNQGSNSHGSIRPASNPEEEGWQENPALQKDISSDNTDRQNFTHGLASDSESYTIDTNPQIRHQGNVDSSTEMTRL